MPAVILAAISVPTVTTIFDLSHKPAGKDQALSLAHEIGHHLGLLDRQVRARDLMHAFTGERGINLTRADVDKVHLQLSK